MSEEKKLCAQRSSLEAKVKKRCASINQAVAAKTDKEPTVSNILRKKDEMEKVWVEWQQAHLSYQEVLEQPEDDKELLGGLLDLVDKASEQVEDLLEERAESAAPDPAKQLADLVAEQITSYEIIDNVISESEAVVKKWEGKKNPPLKLLSTSSRNP